MAPLRRPTLTALLLVTLLAAGCGSAASGPSDGGGSPDTADTTAGVDAGTWWPDEAPTCEPSDPAVLEPLWLAGGSGSRAEVGKFGKPDAIFLDDQGLLLAGDEHKDYEELHLYDVDSDDPEALADFLEPVLDLGAEPGPAGAGELEFYGISGFAKSPVTGDLFVVEQKNGRVQILRQTEDPSAPPYYVFDRFFGAFAADKDAPQDGEFVRLQAARADSLGRLMLSDDAKHNAKSARRDVQVFSAELEYLTRFGDASYGPLGQEGNLEEPENFVIDEARDRIYVCDEGPGDLVVYRYSDLSFVQRVGEVGGVPNGVDIDQYGFLYVVTEGFDDGAADEFAQVLDPADFSQRFRWGGNSGAGDVTPGLFHSPDTLLVDVPRDLLLIADQGHDRIQGFSLSEVQGRACVRTARLTAPPRAATGSVVPVRVDVFGPDGALDVRTFEAAAAAELRDDAGQIVASQSFDVLHGRGGVTLAAGDQAGELELTVRVGGLTATGAITVVDAATAVALDDALEVAAGTPVRVSGEVVVPAGETLTLPPGALVLMDAGATLRVDGALQAEGTLELPIAVVPAVAGEAWASVVHSEGAGAATYRHVLLSGGGDAEPVGHCCGPAILHQTSSPLTFADSAVLDSPGKAMWAGGPVELTGSLFQRLGMGPELAGPEVLVEGCHFLDLQADDDADALYVRDGAVGTVRGCVAARAADDGLDLFGVTLTVEGCLVRAIADKAVSVLEGDVTIESSLLIDSAIGVAVKDKSPSSPTPLTLRRTTLARHAKAGLLVFDKGGTGGGAIIEPVVEASILWDNGVAIDTDYDPARIVVRHSDLETDLPVSGNGNLSTRPAFVAPERGDFRLNPLSPAATAGPDGGPIGWPGWGG